MSRRLPKGQENPFLSQEGGSHYVSMGMQRFEFSYANGYDALGDNIFKYLIRHKKKGGASDLKKAVHCIKLRLIDLHKSPLGPAIDRIKVAEFASLNKLDGPEISMLETLHLWLQNPDRPALAETLIDKIEYVSFNTYPPSNPERK